jgi:uncharacterized membrane protein YgcG
MKRLITFALLAVAVPALAQPLAPAGQTAPDRWAAWRGCWQLSEESIADVARLLSEGASGSPTPATGGRVCVAPAPDGSAAMTTLVNDKPVQTEIIVPDGKPHPLSDPGCRGTQQAEWSQLGPRIYARTEVACGDQPVRIISGFSAVVSGPLWLDIQMVESGGRKSMRVRRYRPVMDRRADAASPAQEVLPLGGRISIPEIKEAATKVAPETLQAIVLELGAGGYDLNARRLIELDDAGVPESVIDLMVALSFPKKFVVEHATPSTGPGGFGDYAGLWGPFAMWPYYAHPMYYRSYYSPFGYYNWGYYDPYYYYPPGVVVINPGPGGGGLPEASGAGRVVDGHGYTRIRPNVPDRPARTNDGIGGSSSASGSSGSNSGGSSVSTGGYSGGGGGGGERVAVPRPPGGR